MLINSVCLAEHYGCEIRSAIFDFEKDDLEDLPKELEKLDVGILSEFIFRLNSVL